MLEYSKLILEKVSFDVHLFRKEMRKMLRLLSPDQASELVEWSRQRFSREYWSGFALTYARYLP